MLCPMMREMLPFVVQAGGEVLKEVAIGAVRSHFARPPVLTPREAPAVEKAHGCPYCSAARSLAPVFFYMARAQNATRFGEIYTRLAQKQVAEALSVLDAMPGEPDAPTMRLSAQLVKLDVMLSRPVTAPDYRAIAATVAEIMDFDLELAERYNASATTGDELAARVEAKLARMDGAAPRELETQIIEGTARVVE